jgi:serine/threonine protein kinase
MVPAMQDATGAGHVVAGRYELLVTIGHGATGTVWRARDLADGRDLAIKEVHVPPPLSEQARRIRHERSLREARVAARLRHPGVVTVHDVIEADGNPWIVMDLVAGTSLAQVLADGGPVPPERAAQLGTTLLGALASAHAAGVVHRDVKPANVLITSAGQAVLTDFGLAVLAGEPQLTQAGMVMGTPGFCAPERIRGQPASPASDLWSLGATLYAAVAGQGPFDSRGSLMAVLASIVHDAPPQVPPAAGRLGPVIAALMSKDPAAPPGATTAAGMLADVCGERAEPGPATMAEPGPGRAEPGPGRAEPGPGRPGRHRRALARTI